MSDISTSMALSGGLNVKRVSKHSLLLTALDGGMRAVCNTPYDSLQWFQGALLGLVLRGRRDEEDKLSDE